MGANPGNSLPLSTSLLNTHLDQTASLPLSLSLYLFLSLSLEPSSIHTRSTKSQAGGMRVEAWRNCPYMNIFGNYYMSLLWLSSFQFHFLKNKSLKKKCNFVSYIFHLTVFVWVEIRILGAYSVKIIERQHKAIWPKLIQSFISRWKK